MNWSFILLLFMCLFCWCILFGNSKGEIECRVDYDYNSEPPMLSQECSKGHIYCFSAICDTKFKDRPILFVFGCANATDIKKKSDYCSENMKTQIVKDLPDEARCFCYLGEKGKSMTNRYMMPKEEIPDDILRLFVAPKDNSIFQSQTICQKNALLLNALLLTITFAIFFNGHQSLYN